MTRKIFFSDFFNLPGLFLPPGVWGSQTFSNGLQLSEYVQVVCRNMIGTCLKSVSKTTTFSFFPGFPAIKETVAHIQPNGQSGENYQKSTWKIFSRLKDLPMCKVSEKNNERFPRKSVSYVRTHARTYEHDS